MRAATTTAASIAAGWWHHGCMPASTVRNFLLALALLVGAFGLISVFTPRGFSWGMEFTAVLLALPWLIRQGRSRFTATPTGPDIPDWHPESGTHTR